MRYKGKITSWSGRICCGHITPDAGGKLISVHFTAFSRGQKVPKVGTRVSYDTASNGNGMVWAENVTIRGLQFSFGPAVRAFLVAAGVLAGVAWAAHRGLLPFVVLWLYLCMSALSVIFYVADKSAAKRGAWRTSESTLHLLALCGGWPGALFAQQLLRHKTSKESFRAGFWLTVMANAGVLIYVLSPYGAWLATELKQWAALVDPS